MKMQKKKKNDLEKTSPKCWHFFGDYFTPKILLWPLKSNPNGKIVPKMVTLSCGLYYKIFMIVIYDPNAIGQYYETTIVDYDRS